MSLNGKPQKGMNQRCDQYEFTRICWSVRISTLSNEVATPDHWHALATIHSCQSGKDVYCQKPLAYTIAEGLAMVKAVTYNKRVLQVGSQQRSSREFQAAIDMVQNGAIGHIEKIYARVGEPPTPLSLPEMPVPANLNFNQWMGPLNDPKIHYHPDFMSSLFLWIRKRTRNYGAHGVGIKRLVMVIPLTGRSYVRYRPSRYRYGWPGPLSLHLRDTMARNIQPCAMRMVS